MDVDSKENEVTMAKCSDSYESGGADRLWLLIEHD